MNEQIEGLWWKAQIGYNNQNCDPEVLAKFAELIVGECIKILADNSEFRSCVIIGKHFRVFGVEE